MKLKNMSILVSMRKRLTTRSNRQKALVAIEEGDSLRVMLSILRKLTRHNPINTIGMKREIADRLIATEKYMV